MQEFLLNDKVITQLHMKAMDLKQKTKYVKKYDISFKKRLNLGSRNQLQQLLQTDKKNIFTFKNDEPITYNSKKTKNLFQTLNLSEVLNKQFNSSDQNTLSLKTGCFTVRGIKKSMKQLSQMKKQISQRTCSLITSMKNSDCLIYQYDVSPDIKFKRSPRCFISPQSKNSDKYNKFQLLEKQNVSPNDNFSRQDLIKTKHSQRNNQMTIKQIVQKQIYEQAKKRKGMCRTAPTKYSKRINQKNIWRNDNIFLEEDICRAEAKIYSQIHENKQKSQKRSKDMIGINLQKNKPFSNIEVNKNTVKLLKKYRCQNMVYFNKFVAKQ